MEATHLARLRQEQDKAIEETENKIAQWQQYQSDYEALHRRLRTLPDKVEHDVMVPFGSLAFMPGRLVHTNEVMVLLGDNWFVERSAKQAAEIVSRRIKAVEENLEKLREEKRLLTPRQVFTQELEDMAQGSSDMKEIVEKYDSDTEKEWRVQHKKNVRVYREKLKKDKSTPKPEKKDEPVSDEALWARLDELEKLEAEQHEFDKMDNDVEEAGVTTKGRQPSPPPAEQQRRVSWADEARHDGSDTESDEEEEEEEESTSASDYDTDTEEEMARKQMSRITFTHSSPQKSSSEDRSTSNTEDSGEVPEIRSPSDIYKQFLETPQPKSILKKKKTKDRTMQERKAAELEREKAKAKAAEDLKNAFTGTVVENPTRGAGTAETCTAPPTRPVSKFRAQRQQRGGAKR